MNDLHAAAYDADLNEVRKLLHDGQLVDEIDQNAFTPLLWSCFRGAVGEQLPVVAELLRSGANPNAFTVARDATCVILAVQSGNVDLVNVLVESGAELDLDADNVTPLMQAARDGNEDMLTTLLKLGASPALSRGGFTAADYASHGGHNEIADVLKRMI